MSYEEVLKQKEKNNRTILKRFHGQKVPIPTFDPKAFQNTSVEIARFNSNGFFHKIHQGAHFKNVKQEWRRFKKISHKWLSRGFWPGIWLAMDSPYHTFTIAEPPIYIVRFYFKSSFFIFDPFCPTHQKVWKEWKKKEINKRNRWETLKDFRGITLMAKAQRRNWPWHFAFYRYYRIGAVLGYEDFIAPVIVNPESVAQLKFMEL